MPMSNDEPKGVPGWFVAIIGLALVALTLIGVLLTEKAGDGKASTSGRYEEVDIVCYEGYSYLHNLGPTPLTLQGKQDFTNC